MEQKINIAELLKDCPSGMELDCTMIDNVVFEKLDVRSPHHPIIIIRRTDSNTTIHLTKYGQYSDEEDYKCVIYPKGKTTWEGFVPPCQFKTGDVIYVRGMSNWIAIYKENIYNRIYDYVSINVDNESTINRDDRDNIALIDCSVIRDIRLATEEEKQKLFDAIKANGYKWNAETKTLEKLIEPKFKVGDRIRKKGNTSIYTITYVNGAHYFCGKYVICDTCDDDWELVPDKFDITTLKHFESKVLIRNYESDYWKPAIFGFTRKDKSAPFCVEGGNFFKKCIPYEGNEYLLGTTNDCDEFYKTW